MSISAMKQALEALEAQHNWAVANTGAFTKQSLNAIAALRQALAQPDREWVGLTEYQRLRFADRYHIPLKAVEAIEAKLKERNT